MRIVARLAVAQRLGRIALSLLVGLPAGPVLAQDGTAIFDTAAGLEARLGRSDGPILPKGTLTCAGCHGPDGRGGAEGGLQPAPPINWQALSTATPERPAYDADAMIRLLGEGITPAGRQISARMPRFTGRPEVMAALIQHLQSLDITEQQGLGPDRIAIALPTDPALHAAATAAIAAFNAEGGSFGRQAVVAEPAFLDLDPVLAEILPRLIRAEEARLQALLRTEPDLRPASELPDMNTQLPGTSPLRIAGTLDQIGPELTGLLARQEVEAVAIGPSSEAILWAMQNRQNAGAAHAYAAIRAALNLLREHGRHPTRTRLVNDLKNLDLNALIEVYR